MGLFQNVQTQSQPLELLTAVVRDKALNPLSGVAVEFFVKTGQAYFAPEEGVMIADMNGKTGQKITLKTDKNGLVAVRPYIGEEEGLVEIQARLATIAVIGGGV
jgi:hypothetical protein